MSKINMLLNTDSYKASHYLQYPENTEYQNSYIESRGGRWNHVLFYGLQMFIKEYLLTPITHDDVDEAVEFWKAHGLPFNEEGARYIVDEHNGYFPVKIEAAPEGSIIPTNNVLVQVVNTDPKCAWVTSFLETALLRAIWYPTTVATNSYMCKKIIKSYMEKTSDNLDGLEFKLHDFGARGVSSYESAGIGGSAHLINFMGTDTVTGALYAMKYYNADKVPGFSIPASEHSTMTSWGGEPGEINAFENMLDSFGDNYKLIACVSDSYNIWNSVKKWKSLEDKILEKGVTIVIRPDSGNPVQVVSDLIEALMEEFGSTINSKGYKVLPNHIRVIQGDGIREKSIGDILNEMEHRKLSADNVAFGMGCHMLQHFDRDVLRFAMKCSAIRTNGEWIDVYKDPITDQGKISKKGVLNLIRTKNGYKTIRKSDFVWGDGDYNCLNIVYEKLGIDYEPFTNFTTFELIRKRANDV